MKSNTFFILLFATFCLLAEGVKTSVEAQSSASRQHSLCTANLTAQSSNARITLRSGPGTNYKSKGYGLVGDFVYILSNSPPEADYQYDNQGYVWYRVEFARSKAMGWIREDFLDKECAYD